MRLKRSLLFGICAVASSTLLGQQRPLPGDQPVWTLTEYPDHIRQLTHFGERADWSHDGKKILFVGRTFGDVYEVEVETGIITPVTHHYYHGGYTRALYLANGDILLSGPHQFNPEAEFEWRRWRCECAGGVNYGYWINHLRLLPKSSAPTASKDLVSPELR